MIAAFALAPLLLLAWSDLRRRRLSNRLTAAYGLLCPLALIVAQAPPAQWLQHGAVALVTFLALLGLFASGVLGGGDVKLGTAVMAWAGLQSLWIAGYVIALTGMLLAILGLLADLALRTAPAGPQTAWHRPLRALSARRGVPYGVALVAGGLAVLPSYW